MNKQVTRFTKLAGLLKESATHDFEFERAAIEAASGEKLRPQTEEDDYGRALYFSIQNPHISYFVGDGKTGKVIVKYNAKTGTNDILGNLDDYDGGRSDREDPEPYEDDYDTDYQEPGEDFGMAETKRFQEIAGIKKPEE